MPDLFLLAGPNGAGKSTLSTLLLPFEVKSFDADEELMRRERQYPDIDPGRLMEGVLNSFEEEKNRALSTKKDFAFETNFVGDDIIKTVRQFKLQGYRTNLIFLGLDSAQTAIDRVKQRVAEGGHSVSHPEIRSRYKEGLKNLKEHVKDFDRAIIFTNTRSKTLIQPQKIYRLVKGKIIEAFPPLPKWIKTMKLDLKLEKSLKKIRKHKH